MHERFKSNLIILIKLLRYFIIYKDCRFIQALWNLDIINDTDRYYEESNVTLKKLLKNKVFNE